MVVDLTPQEIVAARGLLEVGLKAAGRNAVQAFVVIDNKLAQALQMEEKKQNRKPADGFSDDADAE